MPNSPLSHAQPPPHYLMHPPLFTSQLSTYIFCKTSSSFNSFILLTSDCGTLYLHAHIKLMNSISLFKSILNTQKLALIAILIIIIIIIMKKRTIIHSVLLAYIVIILYLTKQGKRKQIIKTLIIGNADNNIMQQPQVCMHTFCI